MLEFQLMKYFNVCLLIVYRTFLHKFQTEETVLPYLSALADFRNSVRDVARTQKCNEILTICDALRDDVLPNLGVRLEDRDGAAVSIKLVDRDTLLKERDAKKQAEAQKQALKDQKRQEAAAAAAAIEAQRKINPKEMFLNETDKYSVFDERVSYKICNNFMNLICMNESFPNREYQHWM